MNSSSQEVYFHIILYARAIHMARLYQMNMEIQMNDEILSMDIKK